jgi:hypothetical protein
MLLGTFRFVAVSNDVITFAGYFDLSGLEALRILTYASTSRKTRRGACTVRAKSDLEQIDSHGC